METRQQKRKEILKNVNNNGNKSIDFGISRMKYSRCVRSWWVRIGYILIDGKKRPWFQKSFPDREYGGKYEALIEAQLWRDDQLEAWEKIACDLKLQRRVPFYTGIQSNNKSGRNGVFINDYMTIKDGRPSHCREYVAVVCVGGRKYQRTWSCHKYTDDGAFALACDWREKQEKMIRNAMCHD